LFHLVQHPAAVIGVADVALVDGDPQVWMRRANLGQELLRGLVVVPEAGRDVRALVGQLMADGGADAAGAAGDERPPPLDQPWPGPSQLLQWECGCCHCVFPVSGVPADSESSCVVARCSVASTDGSRRVVASPGLRPSAISRSSLRMILPDLVLGTSSAQMIRLGRASLPMRSATC